VLPGTYAVALSVGGHTQTAKLVLREDPRVTVADADLAASFALSQRIGAALARARQGHGEMKAVKSELAAASPTSGASHPHADPEPDQVRATADFLAAPPSPEAPAFDDIDEALGGIETALESVDAAPTAAQIQVVDLATSQLDAAWHRWTDFKSGRLAALNAVLAKAGRPQITIPPPDRLQTGNPDSGQDLP
jgi:hypothetical protein